MRYLFYFCATGSVILLMAVIFDCLCGVVWKIAFSCWKCKESGIDRYEPEFDCEECNGTGLLIFECYSPNHKKAVWMKPLWFRWKVKAVLYDTP